MATAYNIPDYEEWVRQDCPEATPRSKNFYTVANEKAPDNRFYRLDRKHIDARLKELGSLIHAIVEQARPEDKQLVELRILALEIQKVVQSSTADVAFVGAQGTGKSLCINALQHRHGLAQTSAKGKACTSSAVRFRLKSDAEPFSELCDAVVKFMSDTELREIIAEHIRRYRYVHFPIVEGDELSEDDKLASEAALEFFQKVHNTRHDQQAATQLEALLTGDSIRNGDLLETTVEKACQRIGETVAGEDRCIAFRNVEQADLMKRVRVFIGENDHMPTLWPIVAHIEFQLWSYLASLGVNFVDLPGVDDTNLIRVAAVNAIRRKVAFEMLVGRSERVLSDKNLHALIVQSIKAHGAKGTGLLIAQIDTLLLDDEALRQEIDTQVAEPFPTVKKCLAENDNALSTMQEAGAHDDDLEHRTKYAEYITMQAKVAFINQRAREQEEKMRYMFIQHDPNPIYVQAVSASAYMRWTVKGYKARPVLTPEMSGIPDVRKFLLNLCASANWNIYREHIFEKLDMFIGKCRRIMEVKKMDNAFAIILPNFANHVTDLQVQLETALDSFIEARLSQIWSSAFDKQQRQEELNAVVEDWAKGVQWNTYNKALRERGTTCKTTSSKYRKEGERHAFFSWNEEVSEATAEHVDRFEQRMNTAVTSLALDMDEIIEKNCTDVLNFIQSSALPHRLRQIAVKEWNKRKVKIMAQSKRADDLLQEAVRLTHQYATTETDVSCMVAQVNMNDYEKIENEPHPASGKMSRYEIQKYKMKKAMSGKTYRSRSLADRISEAVVGKAKEELRLAFAPFLQDTIKEVEIFGEIIKDHIPPDYELTDQDRASRQRIVKEVSVMVRIREELCDLILTQEIKEEQDMEAEESFEEEVLRHEEHFAHEELYGHEEGGLRDEDEENEDEDEDEEDEDERPTKRIKLEREAAEAAGDDLYWDFTAVDDEPREGAEESDDSDSHFADWR